MKYLSLIIMILMSPSCSVNKKQRSLTQEKVIITYSKGKCLGKCPVFDLYIYNNGRVVYNGIDNVDKKGVLETFVSLEKLKRIEFLMLGFDSSQIGNVNGRDLPFTMLKINNKKVFYRSTRASGNLLKINNLIENIKDNL